MTSNDLRKQFVPVLDKAGKRLQREIEKEQITHIDLKEYAVGSDRYNKLLAGMERNRTQTWPMYMTEEQ